MEDGIDDCVAAVGVESIEVEAALKLERELVETTSEVSVVSVSELVVSSAELVVSSTELVVSLAEVVVSWTELVVAAAADIVEVVVSTASLFIQN